jgi:hypothetical protein
VAVHAVDPCVGLDVSMWRQPNERSAVLAFGAGDGSGPPVRVLGSLGSKRYRAYSPPQYPVKPLSRGALRASGRGWSAG